MRSRNKPNQALKLMSICCALSVSTMFTNIAFGGPSNTSFTYQGRLKQAGLPLNANVDIIFTLWDEANGGTQVGQSLQLTNETITDGLVMAQLDFGAANFVGEGRWLEIRVRTQTGVGSFVTLTPRLGVQPTPYALFALNGNPGAQGPMGPMGPTGPVGSVGPVGPTGPQGVAGQNGLDGAPGAQGLAGPVGPVGPQGVAGQNGVDGAPGAQGVAGPVGQRRELKRSV